MGKRLGYVVLTYGLKPEQRPFAGFLLPGRDEADQMAEDAKTGPGERHVVAEVFEVRTPRAKSASALARAAVRAAPCPFCGAAAGEMCRTVTHIPSPVPATAGYTISQVHGARQRAAAENVSSSSAATREDGGL